MSIVSLLKKYDIHPRKKFGQNFLTAVPTIEKIVSALGASKDDFVIEIGPGTGIMTRILSEKAGFVAAVETDDAMFDLLEREYGDIPNLHIIHGDILDADLETLLNGRNKDASKKWLFIGNIPYNITSPIIFHLRKYRHLFDRGILTMQKEVAERLTAEPRTKDYGILTIALGAVASVNPLFNISPESFSPKPKVVSSVVEIDFSKKPDYQIDDLDFFTKVVRSSFGTRRKKLKNSMSNSGFLDIPSKIIDEAIKSCGINDNARAEELDIKDFARLASKLSDLSRQIPLQKKSQ